MSFPADVREKALVACARRRCLCHEFKGLKIELHHIVQKAEGGEDTFENCIPLCLVPSGMWLELGVARSPVT
jgi:5-methylcytosine-specific restriction endonuclease McrA